jgi:hypothetical protein
MENTTPLFGWKKKQEENKKNRKLPRIWNLSFITKHKQKNQRTMGNFLELLSVSRFFSASNRGESPFTKIKTDLSRERERERERVSGKLKRWKKKGFSGFVWYL